MAWPTPKDIEKRFPDEVQPYRAGEATFRPGGGESLEDVQLRWKSFFGDLVRAHRDDHVALVAHGGLIRVAL
ncbi:MAG: histidine phosphatase family protein, partial [Nitrospinae bacterium]|nr:histidine phosphatase family protein [Nitrospinota bacterium]